MSELIGLDIGQGHVTAARVVRSHGRLQPLEICEIGLPSGVIDERSRLLQPESLKEALRALWSDFQLKGRQVNVSIGRSALYTQTLVRPQRIGKADLDSSVRFEMIQGLGFTDTDNAEIRHTQLGVREDADPPTQVLLAVAVHRDVPARMLDAVRAAKLKDVAVEGDPLVIARSLALSEDPTRPELIVDIGMLSTSLVVVKDGNVWFNQSVSLGSEHFTGALTALGFRADEAERFKMTSSLVAPEADDPFQVERRALRGQADALANAVFKVLSYADSEGLGDIERVWLCGSGSMLDGLPGHLASSLGVGVQLAEPSPRLQGVDEAIFPRHALALSLAMREDK